eukprot:5872766-Pyramimonas_sp.AAC.1
MVFETTFPTKASYKSYWHGTTFHCLPSILQYGLKNSSDTRIHECTDVGVYVADTLTWGGAFYHGVATRFSEHPDFSIPYTRIVLKVGCDGPPKTSRSYGECYQLIFDEKQIVVEEIH